MKDLLRRLLWRVFPPPEVRATRVHIREFLRRVSPTYPLPGELRWRALALTGDAGYVVELVRAEHRTSEQVALVTLASTVISLLRSGRYHVYRGVLSGEGHALSSAFTRCMLELQRHGYQTDKETEQALGLLRDEIKKLG